MLQRRLERERNARIQAEQLLEARSRELFLANRSLFQISRSDPLTGLLNRAAMLEELSRALSPDMTPEAGVAFALIDLDWFKRFNDTYGHRKADLALQQIAERVRAALPDALLARWGGDEFAILLPCQQREKLERVLQDLLQAMARPFQLYTKRLNLAFSVGAALAPEHTSDPEELRRLANAALLEVKKLGRGNYAIFDTAMREELDFKRDMEKALQTAITSRAIIPWFQPIFKIDGTQIVSLEVLARWNTPEHGYVPPSKFIPMAGSLGLMNDLDHQLAQMACRAALGWLNNKFIESISINISPRELGAPDFADQILQLVKDCGVPPGALILELTEDALFEDYDGAKAALEKISSYGIRLALDDFGVGYSNLHALAEIPFSIVKLDRSLVQSIETDMRARTLTGAVIHLSKTLGLTVVAEGVENEMQAILLRVLGADRVQGFLYSKALPENLVEAMFIPKEEKATPPAAMGMI